MKTKKKFKAPKMRVVGLAAAQIMAASGGAPKTDGASFEGYQDGEFSW